MSRTNSKTPPKSRQKSSSQFARHFPTFHWLFIAIKNSLYFTKDALRFRKINSVRFEITIIYTLILGLVLLSLSGVFYTVTSRTLYRQLDNELRIKAQSISDNIQSYLDIKGEETRTLEYAAEQTITREGEILRRWWYTGFERDWFKKLEEQDLSKDLINFVALNNTMRIGSKNLATDLLGSFVDNMPTTAGEESFWDLDNTGQAVRVINFPYPSERNVTHYIQVGISKGPVIHILNQWMQKVFLSIPIILLLTGFVGRFLASRILKPLNYITQTANHISYENLNLRVDPKFRYQEMDSLIVTFNGMIERLEESFSHIENFSAHVAHELKTPLTIIRGEAELSLMESISDENKAAMTTIICEIDTLLKTIDDLLFLSKTNYELDSFAFSEVNLTELLATLNDHYAIVARRENIDYSFSIPDKEIYMRGDGLHLRRLFLNLLDNAFKFTEDNGQIIVHVELHKEKALVRISDSGVGIAPENIEKVFDQFFHEEHRAKGVGLGLSIVRAIAKAHNTRINVTSELGKGTIFTVTLPVVRIESPVFA